MKSFREWLEEKELNEAKASTVYTNQVLNKRQSKEMAQEYSASKKGAVKVKIDRMLKFNLPKNLQDDRDTISSDIETSQMKGIKAKELDDEFEIFGKRSTYRIPKEYVEVL